MYFKYFPAFSFIRQRNVKNLIKSTFTHKFRRKFATSVTVSQSDRHRALCFVLTDDIAVQCVYDLSRGHGRITSTLILPLVKMQIDSASAIASQTISSALISVCSFSAFAAASADFTCSGTASVAMSSSCGSFPSTASRTAPPTR